MGAEDDLNASLTHLILCASAGAGLGRTHVKNFSHPGLHVNYFVHGMLGFLHYQSGTFNNDFTAAYRISTSASRYLAIPCLMADLYRDDQNLSALHLISGLIPFVLALSGQENPYLGNLMLAGNIVSLAVYSHNNNREWGWYTAGAAVLAYFVAPQAGRKISYPLFLALVDYCAYRVFSVHFAPPPERGRRF